MAARTLFDKIWDAHEVADGLIYIDYAKRTIEPFMALEWSNPDPLTWRIRLREGVKWHKDYGEVTAEDLAYTWNFHLESKSFQVGTALFPVDTVKTDDVTRFEAALMSEVRAKHADILKAIRTDREIKPEIETKLKDLLDRFLKTFA